MTVAESNRALIAALSGEPAPAPAPASDPFRFDHEALKENQQSNAQALRKHLGLPE